MEQEFIDLKNQQTAQEQAEFIKQFQMSAQDYSLQNKYCIQNKGYPIVKDDKQIKHFLKKKKDLEDSVGQFESNRLSYLRYSIMRDKLINQLKECRSRNRKTIVLNLGCGQDTFIFNIQETCTQNGIDTKGIAQVELDLPTVINKKLNIIASSPELKEVLSDSKDNFILLDLQVFDLTKTESVLALVSMLEGMVEVEDCILQCEGVCGMIQNEYVLLLLQKLKEMKSNVFVIMFDQNIDTRQIEKDDEAKDDDIKGEEDQGRELVKKLSDSGISLQGLYTVPNMEDWVKKLEERPIEQKVTQQKDLWDIQRDEMDALKLELNKVEEKDSDWLKKILKCYFVLEANLKR